MKGKSLSKFGLTLIKMKDKGQTTLPGVWIIILVGMFVVTLVYIIFNQIVTGNLYDLAVQQNVNSDTLGAILTSWESWPILFLFALFLYGLSWAASDTFAQRKIR